MSCPLLFGKESLAQLQQFVKVCVTNPDVLRTPELRFFKDYIESLGGTIPPPKKMSSETAPPPSEAPPTPTPAWGTPPQVDSDPESDLEIDTSGCVEPDVVDPDAQKMGDPAKEEIGEEDQEKSNEKRAEAVAQFSEGNFDRAIELYTEAIELNPLSALLLAKRGQVYLKLTKPNACIRDCTRALELNPDSAAAYKFRGRAYRLLGEWEQAAKDLRQACNIDLDEQTDEWLKEVNPNAHKIEQHRLKQERKKLDKEEAALRKRREEAAKAHAKAAAAQRESEGAAPPEDEADPAQDFYKLLQDPEIMAAFADPEVSAAFADISSNPANMFKYKDNPKVFALIQKLTGKLSGGFPGFPGGFPGFGGAAAPAGGPNPTSFDTQDDNLD